MRFKIRGKNFHLVYWAIYIPGFKPIGWHSCPLSATCGIMQLSGSQQSQQPSNSYSYYYEYSHYNTPLVCKIHCRAPNNVKCISLHICLVIKAISKNKRCNHKHFHIKFENSCGNHFSHFFLKINMLMLSPIISACSFIRTWFGLLKHSLLFLIFL